MLSGPGGRDAAYPGPLNYGEKNIRGSDNFNEFNVKVERLTGQGMIGIYGD